MATLKTLVDETTNIKNELKTCHSNLKNNLIEKGVECSDTDKMSSLIDKVDNFLVYCQNLPKWGKLSDFWINGADIITPRYYTTGQSLGKYIYLIGGETMNTFASSKVERYDTELNICESMSSMPTSKTYLTSSLVGENIYVFGGNSKINYCYNIPSDTWTEKASVSTSIKEASSSSFGDLIYLHSSRANPTILYCYDTVSDTWTSKGSKPNSYYSCSSAFLGDNMYVIGGIGSSSSLSNSIYAYNIISDTWSLVGTLTQARCYHSCTVLDNSIYICGGSNGSVTSSVEVFDGSNCTLKSNMNNKRQYFTLCAVNKNLYALAGENASEKVAKIECYLK